MINRVYAMMLARSGSDHKDIDTWVHHLENADGTTGAKWTKDQTDAAMKNLRCNCDPEEFWAAMNMLYSDYSQVSAAYNIADVPGFYAKMAQAFLCDKDAVPDKLEAYMKHVAK